LRDGIRNALRRFCDYLGTHFAEFSMIVFIALYWAWSIQSPLNIGFRHLLPTLPFLYMLATLGWKQWLVFRLRLKSIFSLSLKSVLLFVLLFWFLIETLSTAPYFLSYFNQLGGGTRSGYRYVTDSNYDWGQDLLRLKMFVDSHPEIDKIAVDYFGGGNPKYYLGDCSRNDSHGRIRTRPVGNLFSFGVAEAQGTEARFSCAENWWSSRGNPSTGSGQAPPIHWLAVSINILQGAIQPLHPGQRRNPEDEYRWLTTLRPPAPGLGNVPEPNFRAGTSIFIYKL